MPTSRFQWRALAELGALLLVILLWSTTTTSTTRLCFANPIRGNFSLGQSWSGLSQQQQQKVRDANNLSNNSLSVSNRISSNLSSAMMSSNDLSNNTVNTNNDSVSSSSSSRSTDNPELTSSTNDYFSLWTSDATSPRPPRHRKKRVESENKRTTSELARPRLHRHRRKKLARHRERGGDIGDNTTLTLQNYGLPMTPAKFRKLKRLELERLLRSTTTTTTTESIQSIESEMSVNLETHDGVPAALMFDDCLQPDNFKQLIKNLTDAQNATNAAAENCTINDFIAPPITNGSDNADERIGTGNDTDFSVDDFEMVTHTSHAVLSPAGSGPATTTETAVVVVQPTRETGRSVLSRTERSLHLAGGNGTSRRGQGGAKGKKSNLERNERSANLSHITGTARKIQLYIKNRFLQLLPDGTVNGTQEELSEYTILQRTTVDIGQIKVQGVATCLFLCMDACGSVYGSKDFTDDCIFNESMEQHHYNTYSSSRHSNSRHILYLGFNRHGQPRKIQIPATRPLGKLATYTKALTQTVPVERVDRVVGRLFGPNHVRHGLKQLCESGRSLQQLTAKVMKPKPKCNSSSSSNSNNTNSNSSNSNLAKLKKKRKKRRKCREDEPESDQCFKGAPGPMVGAKKKGGGMAQQKNQKNQCTDEECGATKNGPKRGPAGKKPNNGNRGGGGGGMGPGGKKNKKPSGPMHKRMRMTSTTTPKPEEEEDELEEDAMAISQEVEDEWDEGAGGAASLTSNFIAHDYEDPFQF